jgi:hypothetical protein
VKQVKELNNVPEIHGFTINKGPALGSEFHPMATPNEGLFKKVAIYTLSGLISLPLIFWAFRYEPNPSREKEPAKAEQVANAPALKLEGIWQLMIWVPSVAYAKETGTYQAPSLQGYILDNRFQVDIDGNGIAETELEIYREKFVFQLPGAKVDYDKIIGKYIHQGKVWGWTVYNDPLNIPRLIERATGKGFSKSGWPPNFTYIIFSVNNLGVYNANEPGTKLISPLHRTGEDYSIIDSDGDGTFDEKHGFPEPIQPPRPYGASKPAPRSKDEVLPLPSYIAASTRNKYKFKHGTKDDYAEYATIEMNSSVKSDKWSRSYRISYTFQLKDIEGNFFNRGLIDLVAESEFEDSILMTVYHENTGGPAWPPPCQTIYELYLGKLAEDCSNGPTSYMWKKSALRNYFDRKMVIHVKNSSFGTGTVEIGGKLYKKGEGTAEIDGKLFRNFLKFIADKVDK